MVKITAALVVLLLLLLAGCNSQNSSPDEVREKTAQATSEIKKDAKAVADGVKEGWNRNQPLDINKASKDQLQSLPGMSAEGAERIIDGRPYSSATELVRRKVISQQEYDKIKDQITASNWQSCSKSTSVCHHRFALLSLSYQRKAAAA